MIYTDLTTKGGRVWAIRAENGLSRRAFAERLGTVSDEIINVEYNRLKKPEQKESLYRNIATEFGVSLDWIKTGKGSMYDLDPSDEVAMAFRELASQHNPTVDGLILFLRSCTSEQIELIAQLLKDCVAFIHAAADQRE